MRPKKHERTGEEDLFRARLDQIIGMSMSCAARWQARLGLARRRDRAALHRQAALRSEYNSRRKSFSSS
jgi:hypothetical protein